MFGWTQFNVRPKRAAQSFGIDIEARLVDYRPLKGTKVHISDQELGFVKDIGYQHERELRSYSAK
jgi:hypothetical protein